MVVPNIVDYSRFFSPEDFTLHLYVSVRVFLECFFASSGAEVVGLSHVHRFVFGRFLVYVIPQTGSFAMVFSPPYSVNARG